MVLPQDHRAEAAAPPCITPNAMDDFEFSGFSDTGGGGEMGECVRGVSGESGRDITKFFDTTFNTVDRLLNR